MSLGEKLRAARLSAGLSQRQLCGEEITRNMLSQIENGSAQPSMSTLQFLARRLEKPVSYFLEETSGVSANRTCLDTAWNLLEAGDSAAAFHESRNYRHPDPACDREYTILRSLLLLSYAARCIARGKTLYARQLLAEAVELEPTLPWFPELKDRRIALQSLMGDPIPEKDLPEVDELLIIHAREAMRNGEYRRAAQILDAAANQQNPDWCLLRGRAAMAQKEYGTAAKWIQQAETAKPQEAIPLLETCFRELGDYKTAYYYACKARN